MKTVDEVFELFRKAGRSAYFGEPVSQEEHALQCAFLAEQAGARDTLIVAALLHDVGHLLHQKGEDIAERGSDARHEQIGHAWLIRRFGVAVAEPVRLHVAAKRFLCATDNEYLAQLSPASQLSLQLQGGPFSASECIRFAADPCHADAVRLRIWDDEAKVADLTVPALDHYRQRLEAAALGT
jgi:phosphonate degradation associated HDIG domain protein